MTYIRFSCYPEVCCEDGDVHHADPQTADPGDAETGGMQSGTLLNYTSGNNSFYPAKNDSSMRCRIDGDMPPKSTN